MTVDVIVGTLTNINANFINPYTGELLNVAGDYYINDTFVSGGAGAGDIALGTTFDQLWLLEDNLGNLLIENVELFLPAPGNDIILLASDTHILGDISIFAAEGDDIVWSNAGNDLLEGGLGNDILHGGLGNDTLNGNEDNDELIGSFGDDTLSGNTGNDILSGGEDNDTYVFESGDGTDIIIETSGFDTISFGAGITLGDLTFVQNGNDLEIQSADNITVKDFYAGDADKVVEQIQFDDSSIFDLTSLLPVLPDAPEGPDIIDFTGASFASYNGNQDAGGTIHAIESATGVEIAGNAWKKMALDYDITENTVISFEYKSTIQGEVQGFGLETDNNFTTGGNSYQLYGSDTPGFFVRDFSYSEAGEWQSFTIDVGSYQTGHIDWMTFINDHDLGGKDGTSAYRNISLYETDPEIVNYAPVASDDAFVGMLNTDITGNLLDDNYNGSDRDADGDVLNVVAGTYATEHGSLIVSENGDFTYTPDDGFSGTDSFVYTLEDGQGANDTAVSTFYVDTLDADDVFTGSAAFDHFDGGAGVDTIDYSGSSTRVVLSLASGEGWGGDAYNDTYQSIENAIGSNLVSRGDTIHGDASDNQIWGLAGNDLIEGLGGADMIDGGYGGDYASYEHSDAGVQINLQTGVNTGGHAQGDVLINIENIKGSTHDDTIIGNEIRNHIYGGYGDDIINGGGGTDLLYGGGGADTFIFEATTAYAAVGNIQDFDLAQNDSIDISDLLQGYDPLTDAISDFVQVTDSPNGYGTSLSIDADGGGDNFVAIAYLADITGMGSADTLEDNGHLITV
tara:strand:- start:4137 stop:6521 length:2385 start_codon:yes stop_codon:yes gene_type:complete